MPQLITQTVLEEWVKILGKGMVTIPKQFRDELGIREGEVARMRKIGRRLILESRDTTDYEAYSDEDLNAMLAADKLSSKLARKAKSFWQDLP